MEQSNFIEAKGAGKPKNGHESIPAAEREREHKEAVEFVEGNRDFFEHYTGGRIKIEPAPEDLDTFAFDLEKNNIYINPMFFKKLGLSKEKTFFATLHEIEHFMEKLQILSEEGGDGKFEKFLKRIKSSRAFSLMDNCVSDIRQNRAVVSWESKGLGEIEQKIYKEDLFFETDFTSQPRHIQFSQALLREARVRDEKCQVSPEVRSALDEVSKVKDLVFVMTDPGTPMSQRLKLQDKYIWPKVEALLEKDIEDKKKEQKGKGESGERGNKPEKPGDKKDGQKSGGDGEKGEAKPVPGENTNETRNETDPNKIFANEYAEVEKKFPEAVPMKEVEEALKKWKKAEEGKNSADKADEEYAKKLGVEKKDLQEYRKIAQELEKIVDPETNAAVMEELKKLFSRIISKRMKKAQAPKYPVEEGDELVDPAELIADVRSGNLQSKVWEDTEIKEKRGDKFGEVEITLVCDRSYSMKEGKKSEEQRKSAVLVMEVLKDFAELCEAEKINIDKPLSVKSEIYGFGAGDDKNPMKTMSAELGEAERIKVFKDLHNLPGSTTDFNCLEAIDDNLDDEVKQKIKSGELKKIVIVFTDGESDDQAKVQNNLKNLREKGVVAIGVGITAEGKAVLNTYAPNALVVEDVSKLPIVLGELLKEHLRDL